MHFYIYRQELEKHEVTYRFFWIGFSKDHDAELLGTIARSGNDLGNFIFIDDVKDSDIQIQNALNQVFDLTPDKSSLHVRIFEDTNNGFSQNLRLTNIEDSNSDHLVGVLVLPAFVVKNRHQIKLESDYQTLCWDLVESRPDLSQDTQGLIDLIYIHMFTMTERVQTQDSKEHLDAIKEEIDEINHMLNSCYIESLKIKLKDSRRDALNAIFDLKERISEILSFLRSKLLNERVSNQLIAKLNHMAYHGVRKNQLQKKLDTRAIQNSERFNEFQQKLEDYWASVNIPDIKQKYSEISEKIGNCFLTVKDVFECIEDTDCMCLCLDVRRSEAAIADPTKLVIKHIVPSYLSADAFIDAAVFALKQNPEAHGGFDNKLKDVKILTGLGRESITGVFPLYLFKEHFEIARLKMPQILGLMWTWDPMGYTPAQFYTVPFLVLHKAFVDSYYYPESDIRCTIVKQVFKVWERILKSLTKEELLNIKQIFENLSVDPMFSTQEHIRKILCKS